MLATANNNEFLFCHLRVVSKNVDHPLKDKFDIFLLDVRNVLLSNSGVLKEMIAQKFPAIFDFRLEILRWLAKENIDFSELAKNALPYFEQMRQVKRLSELSEKIIIALSLNNTVMDSMIAKNEGMNLNASQIPSISFEDWTALVYLSNPNSREAEFLIDWCKCSLFIEYIVLAAFTIFEENLIVHQDKINQLSYIMDEATQAYTSLASELNVIRIPEHIPEGHKANSKGAAIFKKMLDDKNTIRQHLKNGGELLDLKDKFSFANPISFTGK